MLRASRKLRNLRIVSLRHYVAGFHDSKPKEYVYDKASSTYLYERRILEKFTSKIESYARTVALQHSFPETMGVTPALDLKNRQIATILANARKLVCFGVATDQIERDDMTEDNIFATDPYSEETKRILECASV